MIEVADYSKFVTEELNNLGYCLKQIDESLMKVRINEIKEFYNRIQNEFHSLFGWEKQTDDYFLAALDGKFKFSYLMESKISKEICLLNISSLKENILHLHCLYSGDKYRNLSLGKYHLLHICNLCVSNGILEQSAYTHKYNSSAINFYLKLGWKIEDIRKNGTQLYMVANNVEVRDRLFEMLTKTKG